MTVTITPIDPANESPLLEPMAVDFEMRHIPLFAKAPDGAESWAVYVSKAEQLPVAANAVSDDEKEAPSKQGVSIGRKEQPFNMEAARKLKLTNTHHSSCIETKRDCTTGLGFKSDRVGDELDPLCQYSFLDLLNRVCEDYWETGNGYIEVVRDGDTITGLHHISAPDLHINIENTAYDFHYEIDTPEGRSTKFARFGDLQRFMSKSIAQEQERVAEVIHFRRPTSLDRWYGMPDWLCAVPCIELLMAILQHNFDFFSNFGVPDFMLFITGGKVSPEDWKTIKKLLREQVGLGNRHKSVALNIPGSEIKVQLEKLAMDTVEGAFGDLFDTLSLSVVSGHRMPPLLAGIQTPGKLGANNELPNALMTVQALVIGQAQLAFKTTLAQTLGHPKKNGSLKVRKKDFEFNTILDHINLVQMAATSSLRTPVGGKDPNAPNSTVKPDQKKAKPLAKAEGPEWINGLVKIIADMRPDQIARFLTAAAGKEPGAA